MAAGKENVVRLFLNGRTDGEIAEELKLGARASRE
jgi:DNA-binding NarL/FixJ family response regulator